jgi:hypothetical protein
LSIGQFRKSHKNATKCNETQGKWCKNKHKASKIIDTFETYQEKTTFLSLRIFALFILRTLLNAIICCSQLNTQGVLRRFPVSGLLVIDVVGWRSMYFVVMPRVSLIVILMIYIRYLYSINCPTVICLRSMLYLSYGETPLVNCGPRSNFLYIALPFYYCSLCLLFLHYYYPFATWYAHSFVYSKPVRLTTSL